MFFSSSSLCLTLMSLSWLKKSEQCSFSADLCGLHVQALINALHFSFPPVKDGALGQCETPKDPRYPDCPSKMDVSLHISLKSKQFHPQSKYPSVLCRWLTLVWHQFCIIGLKDVWIVWAINSTRRQRSTIYTYILWIPAYDRHGKKL